MDFLIFGGMTALGLFMMYLAGKGMDKRSWNNGQCRKCDGIWYAFGMDSGGARGYKCDHGHSTWISWLKERPIDPKGILRK